MKLELLALGLFPLLLAALASAGTVTVHPRDTGQALVNPAMGWVLHYYDNQLGAYGSRLALDDDLADFPGLSTVYLRLAWSYLEPEEGKFNWAIIDGPAQRWIARGKQIAFRITTCETPVYFATPKWVKEAGAKGHYFTPGKLDPKGPFWEPDYDDPIFLEKLDHFLAAFSARYDGDPNMAFIDVGSFGVWGEGHTFSSTRLRYPPSVIEKHIDLYCKHFKHTLLVANDDFSFAGDEVIDYARQKGLTLRDDSIMVQPPPRSWFHAQMAQAFWPNLPVILESEHYGGSKARKSWRNPLYLQAIEEYHASYASIHWWPREFLEKEKPLIDAINRRLGYRLQAREVTWPSHILPGEAFTLSSKWANAGVAPCYPGGYVAYSLLTPKGSVVTTWVDDTFNVRALQPAPPGRAPVQVLEHRFLAPENLPPGDYVFCISVGSKSGTPGLALPLPGEIAPKRYKLGVLHVMGQYSLVPLGVTALGGDRYALELKWKINVPLPDDVMPFMHFAPEGNAAQILFQGSLEAKALQPKFTRPGEFEAPLVFTLPRTEKSTTYQLFVGLWDPKRGNRMTGEGPDGADDLRLYVGKLVVTPNEVKFIPPGHG